jgi:peptide/nickel transport system substrate-binding protein
MRRFVRPLYALLVALALLNACARQTAGSAGGHNPWTIPGVLRIGRDEEPDSLNLMYSHTYASDWIVGLLYSSILRYDPDGNYIPDLATVVPSLQNGGISRDEKTVTVHLRHGVVWADGAPLTAADWLFTYHAVMNPRNNVKTRYGWDGIASAGAPDPYTIVIHLKRPNVEVLGILALGGSGYPPLPAHLLGGLPDLNSAEINSRPLSSGPFLLQTWHHGESLVFEPNPRYFRGSPKLKQVVWKVVPDVNTLFNQLATHEIDVYPAVNTSSIPRLSNLTGIVVDKRLIANWRHLGINMSRPQLADSRVRQAIALAVDWKRINDTVYRGYDRLAVSDIFPQSWAAPSLAPYRYDPVAARRLLAQDGWKAGTDGTLRKGPLAMHLTLYTRSGQMENVQSAVLIQAMLHAVGIDVAVRQMPGNFLFAQNGPIYTGKYDFEWSIETNGPDPDNSGDWNGAFIPPNGANTSWLNDPIVNATSTAAASTFDQAKRKALYEREEERLRQLNPAIFVNWEMSYTAMNSDVKHYVPAAFIGDTWNAWQWSI